MTRYHRQVILPEFGIQGQKKLSDAAVLVIGAGGLGVPVLQYLTAAGLGQIGIVDSDSVDKSNLHRQVIYTEKEVGQKKVKLAQKKMNSLNSEVQVDAYHIRIDNENAMELLQQYDVILDCTDNFPTRYLVNDACYLLGKPLVYGAIYRWEGQVSVFNSNKGGNYRDLFPKPPLPGEVPNCEEGGVIGVLPGIIGSMMANECIKILLGIGEVLSNKLLMYDAKSCQSQIIKFKNRNDNPLSGESPSITSLIDYNVFCGVKEISNEAKDLISTASLKKWQAEDKVFQLIDVREKEEFSSININGQNIPLSRIKTQTHQIEDEIPVVLVCQTGKRSMSVLQFLKSEHDFDNLLSLEGGINSYLK